MLLIAGSGKEGGWEEGCETGGRGGGRIESLAALTNLLFLLSNDSRYRRRILAHFNLPYF